MRDEGRPHGKRIDLVDRFLGRAEGVAVRRLVQPDMAVADLQECQTIRPGRAPQRWLIIFSRYRSNIRAR